MGRKWETEELESQSWKDKWAKKNEWNQEMSEIEFDNPNSTNNSMNYCWNFILCVCVCEANHSIYKWSHFINTNLFSEYSGQYARYVGVLCTLHILTTATLPPPPQTTPSEMYIIFQVHTDDQKCKSKLCSNRAREGKRTVHIQLTLWSFWFY